METSGYFDDIKELFRQTERHMQETDRRMRETGAEADRRLREMGAETDRRLRNLGEQIGGERPELRHDDEARDAEPHVEREGHGHTARVEELESHEARQGEAARRRDETHGARASGQAAVDGQAEEEQQRLGEGGVDLELGTRDGAEPTGEDEGVYLFDLGGEGPIRLFSRPAVVLGIIRIHQNGLDRICFDLLQIILGPGGEGLDHP